MGRAQYVVVLHQSEWKINLDGTHYGPYKTQQEAITAAVTAARQAKQQGYPSQVLVQGQNNQFRTEWTYLNDPYPPRG